MAILSLLVDNSGNDNMGITTARVVGNVIGAIGAFGQALIYIPAAACLICPAIFLLVFAIAHMVVRVDMTNIDNFDRTTPAAVLYGFACSVLFLLVSGVAIGTVCGTIFQYRVAG